MIGHYLLTLCPEAEDAILTGRLEPGSYGIEDVRCLVGWACDATEKNTPNGDLLDGDAGRPEHAHTQWRWREPDPYFPGNMRTRFGASIEERFDDLCERFGTERIGRLIRDRILANRARRTLVREPWPLAVGDDDGA